MSKAEEYARWVLEPSNERETGRLIKLSAQRFINDLQRTDIYFDEAEAVKMCAFGEKYCNQWEGDFEGMPVRFEPWQRFIFEQVFGWFVTKTKLRRFSDVFVEIAKKNGKSTMCAVLMNYHVLADQRVKTPKVYTAANNEEQAKICVNMAGKIIEASPALSAMVGNGMVALMNYKENITEVVNYSRNGFIKAFTKESADLTSKTAGGKQGINASLGVIDEFGLSADHGSSKPIKTSMVSRKESLMFYITTAGYNMAGPCYKELRKVGIEVLEGSTKRDNYLPILFEIDKPLDEEGKEKELTIEYLLANEWVWKHCNPNIDVSVQREKLREALEDAAAFGGKTEVENKTLNFNIWVDSPSVFIPAEKWNANRHGITEADLEGQMCYGGYEFVGGDKLNSFCLLFPDINGKTVVKPLFWMPSEIRKTFPETEDWVKSGHVVEFEGDVPWNQEVFDLVYGEICKYQMHSFCYRKDLATTELVQSLVMAGLTGNPISHGPQGIGSPTLMWESTIRKGNAEHFGNPVLTWMNSNCTVVRRNNIPMLEKQESRVVGIFAAINALAQWKTIEASGGTSIGILYI